MRASAFGERGNMVYPRRASRQALTLSLGVSGPLQIS